MSEKKARRKRDISPTHPHAAAIDIGATLHVAAVGPDQESTGVYWIPAFEILDQRDFEVILVSCMTSTMPRWRCATCALRLS